MNKYITITSIFPPTEAVIAFAQQEEYKLIVVGDKKSPHKWHCDNVDYISVEQQEDLDFELNQHLPFNHYCRKMLGYLYAMSNNADIIIDTDDDNIPNLNWGFPEFMGKYPKIPEEKGFINIYELYTNQKIWPRGYPLRYINSDRSILKDEITDEVVNVGIWQGLADEDPDVDAIYRLTSDEECKFSDNGSYVLGKGTLSPFNSQNTAFTKDLFPLLYLPAFVTFRFTDILRGLIAQPIMWAHGFNLGFIGSTVIQKRNPHDYVKDFESEIPMYLHTEKVIELVSVSISSGQNIDDNLYSAYDKLNSAEIVSKKEMHSLEAWLRDYNMLKKQLFI